MRRLTFFSLIFVALVFGLAGPVLATGDEDIPGVPFAIGDSISGSVSSGDVDDVYAVSLTVGEEVHIRCDPGTSGDGSFELLVPGVSSISGASQYIGMAYTLSGGSFFRWWADFDYIPAKSGTYYLRVNWDEGSLNYSLSVKRTSRPPLDLAPDSNDIPGTPIGLGKVTGVVSTHVDSYDVYAVGLTVGQPVTIQLTALTSSIGYLTLLDPSTPSISSRYSHQLGERVGTVSTDTAEVQYTPTQTGTYFILVEVGGGFFAENFPYQLSVSGGGGAPGPGEFSDVAGSPYETAIHDLADRGIITGFEDHTFRPNDPVSRQQFAKMIVKTLGLAVTGSEICPFRDVPAQTGTDPLYPAKYVAACAAHGITQGKTPTSFDPYSNISRAQVLTMVVRAADNLDTGTLDAVPDSWSGQLPDGDPDHGANIKKAEYNGLLDGVPGSGGTLAAWSIYGNASRGELAQILWNLLSSPEPSSEWETIKYSGVGDTVLDVQKPSGPALIWIKGNAQEKYFGVTSYGPGNNGAHTYYDLLVNKTDAYEGVRLIDYFHFGDEEQTARLEIKAAGPWWIEIRPLSAAQTVGTRGQIQGTTDDVIGVTGNPGTAHIVGNAGIGYFGVTAYYGPTTMYDLLVNTADPYDGRVMFTHENAVLLEVSASQAWSISLEP